MAHEDGERFLPVFVSFCFNRNQRETENTEKYQAMVRISVLFLIR